MPAPCTNKHILCLASNTFLVTHVFLTFKKLLLRPVKNCMYVYCIVSQTILY